MYNKKSSKKPFEPGPVLRTGAGSKGNFRRPSAVRGHNPLDIDTDTRAVHHTLGIGAFQAAQGSLVHKFILESNALFAANTVKNTEQDTAIILLDGRIDTLEITARVRGTQIVQVPAINTTVAYWIDYPVGTFNVIARVFLSTENSNPAACTVSVDNRGLDGFELRGQRSAGTAAFNVFWEAVGNAA